MRRISRTDDIATRQHGVITRSQLLDAGWSPSRVDREIRARRLHRVHDGVYAMGHRALADRGRWLAAVLACDGVLNHQSAAALHALPLSDNGPRTSRRCTMYDGRASIPTAGGLRLQIGRSGIASPSRASRAPSRT